MTLASKLARKEQPVSPLLSCDKDGCEAVATRRAVLMITPGRAYHLVPHPLDLVLCDEHRSDFPDAETLLKRLDGLWDGLLAFLRRGSSRVPVRKLTRLQWEPCGPRSNVIALFDATSLFDEIHAEERKRRRSMMRRSEVRRAVEAITRALEKEGTHGAQRVHPGPGVALRYDASRGLLFELDAELVSILLGRTQAQDDEPAVEAVETRAEPEEADPAPEPTSSEVAE